MRSVAREQAVAECGVHYRMSTRSPDELAPEIIEILGPNTMGPPYQHFNAESAARYAAGIYTKRVNARKSEILQVFGNGVFRLWMLLCTLLRPISAKARRFLAHAASLRDELSQLEDLDLQNWKPRIVSLPDNVKIPVVFQPGDPIWIVHGHTFDAGLWIEETSILGRMIDQGKGGPDKWDYTIRYETKDGIRFTYDRSDHRHPEIEVSGPGRYMFSTRQGAEQRAKEILVDMALGLDFLFTKNGAIGVINEIKAAS